MSTIHHPVQNHAWWYAAAAAAVVLAGLVAVLMATVFSTSGSGTDVNPPPPVPTVHAGKAYGPPCFAGHAGGPIELSHAGCPAGTP